MNLPTTKKMQLVLLVFILLGGGFHSCSSGATEKPPVDFSTVQLPKDLQSTFPYRKGLNPLFLPAKLAGQTLREDTIFTRTTTHGFRAVLAMYDRIVLMMWKAPTEEDVTRGIVYPTEKIARDEKGAADYLQKIMFGDSEEPGAFYSKDIVTTVSHDEIGIEWFTTSGESTLLWQVPRTQRTSFWFRSGVWFFGIEADKKSIRDAAAQDLIAHLTSLSKELGHSANR